MCIACYLQFNRAVRYYLPMPSGTAIFELQLTLTNRTNPANGARQSAVAASAYRAGENITDLQTDKTHYYANRSGVYKSEILAPDDAPEWVQDRAQLWNKHEEKEIRKDARLFKEVRVALPLAFDAEKNCDLTCEWVRDIFISKGMVADVSFHDMDKDNPHAHIMLTQRHLLAEGFGNKNRDWNKIDSTASTYSKEMREKLGIDFTSQVEEWRHSWAGHLNSHLEGSGFSERVSPLKNTETEGIANLENENLPLAAHHMEAKGEETSAAEHQKGASIRNKARRLAERFQEQLENVFHVPDHQTLVDRVGAYWDNFQKRMVDDYIDRQVPSWDIEHQEIIAAMARDNELEAG